jgi:uncharacterized protein YndB with AHSA1/START domain
MIPGKKTLSVRRSIHIHARPKEVWREFETLDRMSAWWGALSGTPEAGKPKGQRLVTYELRPGGRIEMEILLDGKPFRYGGPVIALRPAKELTIENDWIPNQGWKNPTFITLKLTPAHGGTLVELFHYGFERTGPDFSNEHESYETGWGMTQLKALKQILLKTTDRRAPNARTFEQ